MKIEWDALPYFVRNRPSPVCGILFPVLRSPHSILIAIEGIDGAGKTTQANLLRMTLQTAGLDVVASREPTRGKHGQRIRESAYTGRLSLNDELQAFVDDRREHVETLIGPALTAGKVVILDRYYYSTLAYQGSRGADINHVRAIMEEFAPVPDVVYLIDTKPEVGLHRISHSRRDTPNQFETLSNLTAVSAVFNALPDKNIVKIDGGMSAAAVHRAIMDSFIEGALKKAYCFKSYGCDDQFYCTARILRHCDWIKLQSVVSGSIAAV